MSSMVSPTQSAVAPSVLELCAYRVNQAAAQDDVTQQGISREALTERVAEIVARNLASGRAQRMMRAGEQRTHGEGETRRRGDMEASDLSVSPRPRVPASANAPQLPSPSAPLEAYVDRVIASYLQEHHRVERLAAGDEVTWNRLGEQLARRAQAMLLRRQVPGDRAASLAADFAQETCEIIYSHSFPYDVSFDGWSTLILKNRILGRYTRSPDLIDRQVIQSLDRPSGGDASDHFSLYDLLVDPAGDAAFERTEVQALLIQAIAHLPSPAQRAVIIDTYFYELGDQEIARRLGRSRQAVYNLRHRALRNLRRILADERLRGESALESVAGIPHGGR
jgi:RNA polymerase sigma factor (sigma-70 family)